jgi:NAD(P)-dependent dehydrogenase (short-subunit alcohol dehydrogenase family)
VTNGGTSEAHVITNPLDFSDKVPLVTEAASGMGRATAQAFAEGGAAAALVDFKEDAVKAAEQRLVADTKNRKAVAGKSEEGHLAE